MSNFVLKIIIEAGCPNKQTVLIPNEIKLKKFKYKKYKLKPKEFINIVSVGRLVEVKGHEYAIKAVANVMKKYPNIIYQIVGNGPLYESLNKLIIRLGVEKKIELLGWLKHDELYSIYENKNILVHPSITSESGAQETQGMVLMEAQACGIIVVATNYGAIPEGVLDGVSGFLVPERDVDALAEKLEYLIEHSDIWPDMSKAGRAFIEEKYNSEKLIKKLEDVYYNINNE